MEIYNLIKDGNQNQVDATIESMVAEFRGRSELPGELYRIAYFYEEQPDKMPEAQQMYQRIVDNYPGTNEANRAIVDIRERAICDVLYAGDANTGMALLDKFVADFGQRSYVGEYMSKVMVSCWKEARNLTGRQQTEKAGLYHLTAADIWQRTPKATLGPMEAEATFCAAMNYHEIGMWANAVENYQKVLDNHPDYEYACGINAAIAGCYELMRDKEGTPKETVNPLIEQAYKAVMADANECRSASIPEVAYKLAGIMLDKGDKVGAIQYYQKFLESADPNDNLLAPVKAKLVELIAEGGTN
jgi:tetratricopeptide (TPR) repeat protein